VRENNAVWERFVVWVPLLRVARAIDWVSQRIGAAVSWLILAAVVVGASNAIIRKAFNVSSNAWLELQWYLFSAVFLLCAAYTLLNNEHVRIDVVSSHYSHRTQAWVDIFGTLLFLLPMTLLIIWLSWPMFLDSFMRDELSTDAGGLLRWPVKLLIPVGFTLLSVQGLSELIKRAAFLKGLLPDPYARPADHLSDLMTLDEFKRRGNGQ
jgi:TRAP-type mannitol/chloroaromatic compound transport system permease small subunit